MPMLLSSIGLLLSIRNSPELCVFRLTKEMTSQRQGLRFTVIVVEGAAVAIQMNLKQILLYFLFMLVLLLILLIIVGVLSLLLLLLFCYYFVIIIL